MSSASTPASGLPAAPPPSAPALPSPPPSAVPAPEGPKVPRFAIRPSSLLKSPVVRRTKQLPSGQQQDRLMHLSAAGFRAQRLGALDASTRRRAAEQELCVLMCVAEQGLAWTALDAQLALALARAARDTLHAEEDAARKRVTECERLLATLADASDDARACAQEADEQVNALLAYFGRAGLQVDLSARNYEPADTSLLYRARVDDVSVSSRSDSADSDDEQSGSDADEANS
ncbi:hypothetical protein HYPSUDRAFT_197960 [Hypholoma sublateritium FD-334 SS-4]|uniref:Uncharacterized protein n=1 Tax=Hypholoma sublateritium (strain FD-334 SS-4) TaxID=945553 RepID=A0A0D2LJF6_HYPSF|nr:hypothetical protein HYPSUDRAFT_197960 [Hypholoma sublateritium FD-334 SS-4]